MSSCTRRIRVILVIGLSTAVAAGPGNHAIEKFEGYYTAPSPLCTDTAATTGANCDRPDKGDCVLIKRLDATHAQVPAFSAQINGHICGFSGVATLTNRGLEYVGSPDDGGDHDKRLIMKIENGRLRMTYVDEVKPGDFAPFCASHATLERISFSWGNRQFVAGKECASF